MDQIVGRIENLNPQAGLKPVLRITMVLKSKNGSLIDLMSTTARAFVSFSERGRTVPEIPHSYIGEAHMESGSNMISQGDGNSLTFLVPMEFGLIGDIEDRRGSHDVDIGLSIKFRGVERRADGTIGSRVVAGDIVDDRNPGAMQVSKTVAKSDWAQFLRDWQYSKDPRNMLQELGKTISEAQEAKRQAEEAAKAAKQASVLTAVTSLSQAYLEEAKVLGRRSILWSIISLIVAAVGGVAIFVYVTESLGGKFTVAEAVIRAVVIAAIFGVFTLCLRIYEAYRHLEVVNRHRVNIGRTFEAFKAAQPTERAQEVMAAITAENMLAFGKSGFAGKDSPNQGPLAGATELIKAILEKQGH